MVKAEEFTWGTVENDSLERMKMLIAMEFANNPINPDKLLFVTVNSS